MFLYGGSRFGSQIFKNLHFWLMFGDFGWFSSIFGECTEKWSAPDIVKCLSQWVMVVCILKQAVFGFDIWFLVANWNLALLFLNFVCLVDDFSSIDVMSSVECLSNRLIWVGRFGIIHNNCWIFGKCMKSSSPNVTARLSQWVVRIATSITWHLGLIC